VIEVGERLLERVSDILSRGRAVRRSLKGNIPLGLMDSYQDLQHQLDGLIHPGFLLSTPADRLADLPRYLTAMERRVERLTRDPSRDQAGLAAVLPHQRRLDEALERHARKGIRDPALTEVRWLLEEYRVSLFAQELGTRERVSEKRLARAWEAVR